MEKFGVLHQAWEQFSEGMDNLFENPILKEIAEIFKKYWTGYFKMAY